MNKDLLHRIEAAKKEAFAAGERVGMQKMWDYIQLVLHNPATMGKDTFGGKRIRKLFFALEKVADEYAPAFTKGVDADWHQEKMDASLRDAEGDEIVPFSDRYSELKMPGYRVAQKGWK